MALARATRGCSVENGRRLGRLAKLDTEAFAEAFARAGCGAAAGKERDERKVEVLSRGFGGDLELCQPVAASAGGVEVEGGELDADALSFGDHHPGGLAGGSWAYRMYDENGARRQVGGFAGKGAASAALALALDRKRLGPLYRRDLTVRELVGEYLEQHAAGVDADTIEKLRWQLRHALDAFGDVKADRLSPREVAAWRARLPQGSARDIHQALRQVLEHAVRLKMLEENVAKAVPNPAPRRAEVQTFESWADVDAIAEELGPTGGPLVVFAAGTGLRPEELFALEWRDVDRQEKAVTVRRAFTRGRLKDVGKTDRSRRRVPLRQRAVDALEAVPRRLDSRLVFPAAQGGHIDLGRWRARHWKPAVRGAGLEYRPPYALRHFYAATSLAAGVSLYSLARRMGTSVKMIDATYGHLVADAEAFERDLLDAWDARAANNGRLDMGGS